MVRAKLLGGGETSHRIIAPSHQAVRVGEVEVRIGEVWLQANRFAQALYGFGELAPERKRTAEIVVTRGVFGGRGDRGAVLPDRVVESPFLLQDIAERVSLLGGARISLDRLLQAAPRLTLAANRFLALPRELGERGAQSKPQMRIVRHARQRPPVHLCRLLRLRA